MSMPSRSVGTRLAIAIAVAASCASGARAQDAVRVDPRQQQSMIVTVSADQAVDAGEAAVLSPDPLGDSVIGSYTNVRSGVSFKRRPRHYALAVNASSSARYYPALRQVLATGHSLDANLTTSVGRHTRVSVTQRIDRSPFYQLTPFFADDTSALSPTDPFTHFDAFTMFRWNNTSSSTGVVVTHDIGRRSSLVLNYGSSATWLDGATLTAQSAKATFNYRMTRYATARMGYGRRLAGGRANSVALAYRNAQTHDLDLGVDYNRPLSLSKRTTLAFHSGSSLVPGERGTHMHLSGGASLTRELRRSWTAALDYGRTVQIVDTHVEPVLIDALSLQLDGKPMNRLSVGLSTTLAQGQAVSGAGDRAYATSVAAVRAKWNVGRALTLYGDASVYRHHFGSAVEMSPGLQRHMDRVQVRVGVRTWIPLFR